MTDNPYTYIGTKSCGCTVAAVVDVKGMEKETAKSVAKFIQAGLTIERIRTEDVKHRMKACKCHEDRGPSDNQLPLIEAST